MRSGVAAKNQSWPSPPEITADRVACQRLAVPSAALDEVLTLVRRCQCRILRAPGEPEVCPASRRLKNARRSHATEDAGGGRPSGPRAGSGRGVAEDACLRHLWL